jgi:hypothetical protein
MAGTVRYVVRLTWSRPITCYAWERQMDDVRAV